MKVCMIVYENTIKAKTIFIYYYNLYTAVKKYCNLYKKLIH